MPDYEDTVVDETAREIRAVCIVTRDVDDYADSKVKALSPFELVELLVIDENGIKYYA